VNYPGAPDFLNANCVATPRSNRHRPHQVRALHGRNYLAEACGDAANAILDTAGYNFRRLLE
jgi:hypothetical protein